MDAEGPALMEGFQDLGQRIVQAARMAVAVHLYESVARRTAPDGDALRAARQILRRRVATGGAGLLEAPGDDDTVGSVDSAPAPTTPRLGDLVTDDERDGLMGLDVDPDAETDR
jgi:hypothetical protein